MDYRGLDYETKVSIPTQQLFQQLKAQANTLFENTKQSAIELHDQVAESSLALYEHPVETATRWQNFTVERSNQLYANVSNEIIPTVQTRYQDLIFSISDYGTRSRQALQPLLDNPEQVTLQAFTKLNHEVDILVSQVTTISTASLAQLSEQAEKIISLLLKQPIQAMEAFYYNSLTALLNGYFEIVSSLLVSI